MKIVLQTYNFTFGGPQIWVCAMAERLVASGHEVHVLTFRKASSQPAACHLVDRLQAVGVKLDTVELGRNYILDVFRVKKVLRRYGQVDAIHCNSDFSDFIALYAALFVGIPIRISHSRNTHQIGRWWTVYGIKRRLHRLLNASAANRYLGVSKEAAKSMFGPFVSARRIVEFPSGIDIESMVFGGLPQGNDRGLRILHVGRFAPQKDQLFVLSVFEQLLSIYPESSLLFVGDGPDRASIEGEILNRGLESKVRIVEPQADVCRIMREEVYVFLFPSRWEGTPRVVIEAQASGLPVVTSFATPAISIVVPELVKRLDRSMPLQDWVDAIAEIAKVEIDGATIQSYFIDSKFNFDRQIPLILNLYAQGSFEE